MRSKGSASLRRVEHRRHPPREVLGTPDPPKAGRRVRIEVARSSRSGTTRRARQRERCTSCRRQVETLRSRRRHDVGRVAGEVETAVLHRLDHEAPHAGHALLEDRALRRASSPSSPSLICSSSQIRSSGHSSTSSSGPALDVEAAELVRAQAQQREPALVVRVDELVARRRDRGEDPEPAVRVLARERAQHTVGDARTADAVEAVAAGDDVALELVRARRRGGTRSGALGFEIVELRRRRPRTGAAAPSSSRASMRSLTTSVCP